MNVAAIFYRHDGRGDLRAAWLVLGGVVALLLATVALLVVIFLPAKALLLEPSCNQRGDELGANAADYRFPADACFLTLSDGTVIDADQYRATEDTQR